MANKQDKDTKIIEQVAKLMRKLNISESYGMLKGLQILINKKKVFEG